MAKTGWRYLLSGLWVAVFLGVAAPEAVAADFFRSIDDLPLAPGMTETAEQGVEFDSPAGRIVTAAAASEAGQKAGIDGVRAFYRKALPPLGWRHVSADTYRREGERLTLSFAKAGAGVVVRVRLVPTGQN
jgi:hypothetical protein